EEESWTFSQGEDDEENDEHDSEDDNDEHDSENDNDDDQENVSGEPESDDDGDDFVHPNLSTYKADDQEEEKEDEKANDDDEVSSDQKVSTPLDYELTKEEENQEDDNVMGGEQEDEEHEELYEDLNLNLDRRDAEMTDAQTNQETEELHVTLTIEPPVVQQQSSYVSSDLVSKLINPSPDTSIDLISNPNIQSDIPVNVSVSATTETPFSDTTIPQPPIPIIQSQQQTHDSITKTTIPTTTLPEIPNFASLFDKDLFASYGDVVTLKRGRDDQDKDEEPSAGSNQGTKKRSQPKSSGKSAQAEEHGPRVDDLEEPLHQEFNTRNDDVSPIREIIVVDERLKPLLLIQNARGRQVIPFDHFINNDLEYLKEWNLSQRYTTSITKTKAANYGHVKWIEDKRFYGYATNMETLKDVYSKHRIIVVTSLKIMEFFGYRHLEKIIVRRQDDHLYKFREDDFKRLCRQDIEDMLLLLVEGKLTNLNVDERYQKKINLSKPDLYRSDLRKRTPYTTYHGIQGIIYQDDMDKNRLMRTDELHKFSDGTLNHVCTALNDIATGIQMEYLPKRKWSKQDKQRARVMINAIDKKLIDRRLMRSLEKFFGGRPYRGDLWLLQRTI
ncbi:hypothetical protein Tco_0845277, partial [Tanacetum coccineum]